MDGTALRRSLTVAGVAAPAAVLAHGGPGALVRPAWLAVALAGGLALTAALALAGAQLRRLRGWALRPDAGSMPTAGRPGLGLLVCWTLACQIAAHATLAAAGVAPAHLTAGAPTLHVVLALVGAGVVWLLERRIGRGVEAALTALRRLLELLADAPAHDDGSTAALRDQRACGALRGRAPPAAA